MKRTVEVKDNERRGKVFFLCIFNFTVSKNVKNGRIKLLCDRRREIKCQVMSVILCYKVLY